MSPGKLQLQCIGVPSLEALGTGVARTAMTRNFITSLDDGVPVQVQLDGHGIPAALPGSTGAR